MKNHCKRGLCLLLTLALCAGMLAMLGGTASAATLEERQQGVVAVAWAYYDKGHSVQYDGSTLVDTINRTDGGKTRSTNQVSPEYATPQETMYTVCSDFAHQVYYEAYRYQLTGSAGRCWTGTIVKTPKDDPISVWYYDADEGKDKAEELKKMYALAQPGDIFTVYTSSDAGHTMIYVGDVLGDGTAYIIHSGGTAYVPKEMKETREYNEANADLVDERYGKSVLKDGGGGSIRLSPAVEYIDSHYMKKSFVKMNLLRPLLAMSETEYPTRPATAYRVSHPRLAIDRFLNKTRFNSAFTGETVTMTLTLKNGSKQAYTVPVTEKIPAGVTVKKAFEGSTTSGDTMKWDVALNAGETKTFTCEYEVTAALGEQILFDGSSVGDIPSNGIPIQVGGKKLTAEDEAKLTDLAAGKYDQVLKDAGAKNTTLGDAVYQKILGLNVALPEYKVVTKKLIKATKSVPGDKVTNVFLKQDQIAAEDLTAFRTLVPGCHGGSVIWEPWGIDRCADPRDKHLEPGDVLVRSTNLPSSTVSEQFVYLGNGKYLSYDIAKKSYPIVEEPEFVKCLSYKVFYVMRPTLAYDDVHTLPALPASGEPAQTVKLKFTDVKETDWFYDYVRDLVEDGTVNGMTETTFAPKGTLTYGQALKLIALAVGETEQAPTDKHWASGYYALAREKGWLLDNVDLNAQITRIALCKIAAKAKKLTVQPEKNPFTDTTNEDVLALYKAGVINGMTDTEFQPKGLLTRAQITKIIWFLRRV